MPETNLLHAVLLGVVEAATEFLPVSSTGHLILMGELIGFEGPPGHVFEVAIQFGAVLAVCFLYFQRLTAVAFGLPHDPAARRFAGVILLAFLPAAGIGVLAHGFIKTVLFSPYVVCIALIVGGVLIILIERMNHSPRYHSVEAIPLRRALAIGFIQCLAMIPGTSRSGATILGALLMGVDRRTAAEFSFFLAIPTMLGATVYDLYRNRDVLSMDDAAAIAVGFVTAFLVSIYVVRWLLAFVSRHSFAVFGWYRIAIGSVLLAVLWLH